MNSLSTRSTRKRQYRPSKLTKPQFVNSLNERSLRVYGVDFSEAVLNDLIKDGLMWAAQRGANSGKRANFFFEARDYRRGLQIARLRGLGVTNRNEIKIALFLCGYSLPVYDIKEALWEVYTRYIKKGLSSVRSRHIDNFHEIPDEQGRRLATTLGPLDPTFELAGLRLPSEQYIHALRLAKNGVLNSVAVQSDIREALRQKTVSWMNLASNLIPMLSGLAIVDEDDRRDTSPNIDYVEKLIKKATDLELSAAVDLCHLCIKVARNRKYWSDHLNLPLSAELDEAIEKLIQALQHPSWSSHVIVLALLMQRNVEALRDVKYLHKALEFLKKMDIKISDLWYKFEV